MHKPHHTTHTHTGKFPESKGCEKPYTFTPVTARFSHCTQKGEWEWRQEEAQSLCMAVDMSTTVGAFRSDHEEVMRKEEAGLP